MSSPSNDSIVIAKNLGPEVTEAIIKDFFSFCGKIQSIMLDRATNSAKIVFERASAAKTALLLQEAQLGSRQISVERLDSQPSENEGEGLRQEDKPRTAILAEYLAQGYVIGDSALEKGIELDREHGVSLRFTSFLNSALANVKTLDQKLHVTETATTLDNKFSLLDTAHRYVDTALDTVTGKKIRDFYLTGQKQVLDIHNEARRLADLKKQQGEGANVEGKLHDAKQKVSEQINKASQ
ncbi:Protein vip1 [Neolecta irregularis DAH-3]|uniref:Protein vip1 n=1 Tax=Neolecta irregularis (strain DAH-3) TaxID=1198029 RepID=A0A1U7LUF4_NEOID|nr:Protein vip1 [Neolecta irregularis DAH-3]|eukprot:OLL26306.1 Protein vip1 [Neolecta irregularis DAH-3]